MINLESTRAGWIFRGLGVLFALLAIGLTIWDLIDFNWIWPVNIITLAAGFVNWHFGTKMIRRAREHRAYMERSRAEIARIRGELS